MGGGFAQEVETFLFVAADAGDANHHANEARKTGDGELLDTDGHLGVVVVGVDAECLLAVVAGGEALAGGGDVTVFGEGDEGGVHAAGVSAGEVCVGVVGIGFDLLVGESNGGVGERFDAVACALGNVDGALVGQEGVVGVVGGVEEVLIIELAEDERLEDEGGDDGALWIGFLDGLEAGEGSVVVEDVEVVVGFADLGSEVDGVSVGGGIVGLGAGWNSGGGSGQGYEGGEDEGAEFYAAFYGSSPWAAKNLCSMGG